MEESKQAKIKREGGNAVEFYKRIFLIAWGVIALIYTSWCRCCG